MARVFNPSMMNLARRAAGIKQTHLARMASMGQGTISKIENGLLAPDEEQLKRIADACGVLVSFFERIDDIPESKHLYRKRNITKHDESTIEAEFKIIQQDMAILLSSLELRKTLEIPNLQVGTEGIKNASVAALKLRHLWSIPKGPILNLVQYIEAAGIIVIPIDFMPEKIDGVMVRGGGKYRDIIYINSNAPADRQRFTIAHELGHVVLHQNYDVDNEDQEDEANEFASSLLMPVYDIAPYLYDLELEGNAKSLKRHWKVSIASLVRRARDLGCITERKYRYMNIDISKKGWRTSEPVQLEMESPKIVSSIVKAYLDGLHYSDKELAALLSLNMQTFLRKYGSFLPNDRPVLHLV